MTSNEQGVQAKEFQPALAARFYASESVFTLERERLFHAQWFCVGRAEQVPARGDCLHVHVAGESVLILRGKDDSQRAFYNVCRHRGSRLVRTPPLPDSNQPAATGVMNTGGNAAGFLAPVVGLMVDHLGWFPTLASGSVFALIGAGLWLMVRIEPKSDDRGASI